MAENEAVQADEAADEDKRRDVELADQPKDEGSSSLSGFRKIIVTAALPFVNNVPHLGNLIPTLSADVFARYLRLKKANVIFVCGTDEHGTTTETKAIEEGVTPKEICDKYFKIHKDIYDWLECQFDCFGRTSSDENKEITLDIFSKLDRNGYIIEDTLEQLYCEKDEKFLADRFVNGTCPFCGYKEARGDQCENCGKLLNATELINPRCKICGTNPVVKSTKHLFIDLKLIEPKLLAWMEGVEKNWTENARTMTHAWIKEGLKQRCITRDLKWGIKVPKQGYEDKVFYSWFDAPIGYIGITAQYKNDWREWWMDSNTKLIQFMGKDNIPFHTILFPAFLIGTGDPYIKVSELSVNEYLNYESGQFSKSRGIGVFGDNARDSGIKADIWRFYLMRGRPENSDYQFTWRDFQARTNTELVANIGNLINRTLTFINKFFGSKIPEHYLDDKDDTLLDRLRIEYKEIGNLLEKQELRGAVEKILHASKLGNQYFQEEEPWKRINEDKARAGTSLFVLANICKDLAILMAPFTPEASAKAQKILGVKELRWDDLGELSIESGIEIGKAEILYPKIEDEKMKECETKYAGMQVKEGEESKSSKGTKESMEGKFPLNLKVARILEAKEHPKADKLYVLQIDLGTEKRQLVAGIRPYYSKEELLGRNIIVVTNLKPAKLRGEESKGMLLTADDGKNVRLLSAPDSSPGDAVAIEGIDNHEGQIDYSDFEKVAMTTINGKVHVTGYGGNDIDKPLKTAKEEISVEAEDGAQVR